MAKKDIKNFTIDELQKELAKISIPSYRAKQIFYWVYKRGVCDFTEMNNIPKSLRDYLCRFYYVGNIKVKRHLRSSDRTEKFLFELSDGNFVGTVLIYSANRNTVCLSTQVGCKFGCLFCASGLKGFTRNLSTSEIVGQILFLRHTLRRKMSNLVFMGMGEPLDNYENLEKAVINMNSQEALGIGARKMTVSTCGLIPGIKRFKDLGLQVNLSISLHAVNNKLRGYLMPINKRYPLEKLIRSCREFIDRGGRKITIEYILIKDTNDSLRDVRVLSSIAKALMAKVNLIPCSPIQDKRFTPPSKDHIEAFKKRLIKNRINVMVRESKGKDIKAACGQLTPTSTPAA